MVNVVAAALDCIGNGDGGGGGGDGGGGGGDGGSGGGDGGRGKVNSCFVTLSRDVARF